MRAKAPLGGLGGLNAVGCLLTAKDIRQQSLDLQSKTIVNPQPVIHSWIYARQTIAKAFAKDVFINQE